MSKVQKTGGHTAKPEGMVGTCLRGHKAFLAQGNTASAENMLRSAERHCSSFTTEHERHALVEARSSFGSAQSHRSYRDPDWKPGQGTFASQDARHLANTPSTRQSTLEVADAATRIETPRYCPSKLIAFRGQDAAERAYMSGRWFMANLLHDEASRAYCDEHAAELRVMTEAVHTKGGVTVPTIIESTIISLKEKYGLARSECAIHPMTSDEQIIPRRTGGITAYPVGETTETTDSDMSWDNVAMVARKWAALTRMSSDLSEDSVISMSDTLVDEMAHAFAAKEDACLIDGDGTSTYHGIVGFRTKAVDGNHAGSYDDATAGDDQFAELLLADIIALIGKLPGYAHDGAKWYCSYYAWGACFLRLIGALSGNTLAAVAAGAPPQFMGYPVVRSPAMPSATSAYDETVMLAFGNMRMAATLGDRRGITVRTSADRYLEYDQIGVMATQRYDINVHDIGDASNAGPLVFLRGNAS